MRYSQAWLAVTHLAACSIAGLSNIRNIEDLGSPSAVTKPVRVEQLTPILRSDAKRVRLYYGPYEIFGQKEAHTPDKRQMDPNGIAIRTNVTGFCSSCTVLYAKGDTHFLNSSRASMASQIYQHHIVLLDQTKRTLPWYLCDEKRDLGSSTSAGFIVSGVDEAANYFTTPDGRFKSGYYIGEEQKMFRMQAELINYRDTNTTLYITTEIEYVDGNLPGYSDTSVSLLSVTGCKSPDFRVPNGQTQYNASSPSVHIPQDGYIINAKGHMHDGGINVVLTLNGKVICNSRAIYGGSESETVGPGGKQWETIREMTQCTDAVPVKAGDVVRMSSVYDTGLHPLRPAANGHGEGMEAMGVFFINFATALK